uniref:Unc-93 homolog A2 n=1 Tax=Mus musculus TaxID=10090 RepID=A0A338P720_MOUSE
MERSLKNVLVVSCGFLLLFTAYGGLQNLQSSLYSEQGLGVATLSTLYASVLLSSMFLPPILIKKCGCKWTIVGSMCCYVVFSLGNFHANWYSPSSRPFPVCVPSSLAPDPGGNPFLDLGSLLGPCPHTHGCLHGYRVSDVDDAQGDSASKGPTTHSLYPQFLRVGQRESLAWVGAH